MASPHPVRATLSASSICRSCKARLSRQIRQPHRALSSSIIFQQKSTNAFDVPEQHEDLANRAPRWMQAPSRMQAPYKARPSNRNDDYAVNEDPVELDRALEAVIGTSVRGSSVLEEEVKWLAVTHRSFDHGRKGMNDRLAFLGRRIVELQASLALIDAPRSPPSKKSVSELERRPQPPSIPALIGIERLTLDAKHQMLQPARLSGLAHRYGLQKVVRWKPRQIRNLKSSGIDAILTQTLYAIIGAMALQKGGEVAVQTAKERILRPLGVL